eukprot:1159266-Prymnesium_polylepis.2
MGRARQKVLTGWAPATAAVIVLLLRAPHPAQLAVLLLHLELAPHHALRRDVELLHDVGAIPQQGARGPQHRQDQHKAAPRSLIVERVVDTKEHDCEQEGDETAAEEAQGAFALCLHVADSGAEAALGPPQSHARPSHEGRRRQEERDEVAADRQPREERKQSIEQIDDPVRDRTVLDTAVIAVPVFAPYPAVEAIDGSLATASRVG